MGDAMIRTTIAFHNAGPHTIWAKLSDRLGRDPTNAEAADEVKRIIAEASAGPVVIRATGEKA